MGNAASNGDVQLNRRRIAGGSVLIGIGGLLGFTGMLLVGSAIVTVARRWVDRRRLARSRFRPAPVSP